MLANNTSGTILIRERTLLPAGLAVESEVFLPGWRVIKNLDRSTLARNIEGANWNFFYLAGEIRATAKVVSKRFVGIPFISVTAHSRHIQQTIGLVPAKDFALSTPVAEVSEFGLASGREEHQAEVATRQYTALISSS